MRTRMMAVTLVALLASGGLTQQVDRKKLQETAFLPHFKIVFGIGVAPDGIQLLSEKSDKPDAPAKIATLKKALKGDVSDAERYDELGELYNEIHEEALAKSAQEKAVELYRERVKAHPEDGRLLASYAGALNCLDDKGAEVEQHLRHAIQLAPQDWKVLTTLGGFLGNKPYFMLTGGKQADATQAMLLMFSGPEGFARLRDLLAQKRPTPEQIALAEKALQESQDCFDKAVAAAPQEPNAYTRRWTYSTMAKVFARALIKAARGEEVNLGALFNPLLRAFTPEAMNDLFQVAQLSPNDYRAVALPALYEFIGTLMQLGHQAEKLGGDSWSGALWKVLSEPAKKRVRESMARLEKLGQSKDKKTAAGAAEMLGTLQMMTGQAKAGEASLRRCIALDPSREGAWDMLAFPMVMGNRYKDLERLYLEQLQYKDTARTRLLLAKAYGGQEQWDKASDQVITALKLAPDDPLANLSRAVMLMKRYDDSLTLKQVGAIFTRLKANPATSGFDEEQRLDFEVNYGIYLALSGSLGEAEEHFRRVLSVDEDNREAKAALAALKANGT